MPAKRAATKKPTQKAAPAKKKTAARLATAKAKKPAPKRAAAKAKPAPKPKPAPPPKLDPISAALDSKNPKDRVAAARKAEALGSHAPPAVAQALVRALNGADVETRRAVVAALIALGPAAHPALAPLSAALAEPSPVRKRAPLALALARIDHDHLPAALPVLAELVAVGAGSDKALVQETLQLVPALGVHAVPLLPALLLRLEDAAESEAAALTEAVKAAGPLGADAVHQAAKSAGGPFGAQLVRLLDAYDRPEHVLALGELSRHPDLAVRLAAVEALGRRKAREAVPDLLRALQDPSPEVVAAAQLELKRLPALVVEPILGAFLMRLRQDPPEKRNRAVVAAGELGVGTFDDLGPLLLDGLADPDVAIRVRAANGLTALAPLARSALPRLRGQRKDSSEAVRKAVEQAITAIEQSAPR
ncbi:MAG: HEAT repeat domain-containing protein [Deltaproteobacteria bacterium]|nr:HEAT repeat domain-containing protein [Deltaproteobacteria bacterium]